MSGSIEPEPTAGLAPRTALCLYCCCSQLLIAVYCWFNKKPSIMGFPGRRLDVLLVIDLGWTGCGLQLLFCICGKSITGTIIVGASLGKTVGLITARRWTESGTNYSNFVLEPSSKTCPNPESAALKCVSSAVLRVELLFGDLALRQEHQQ